ncbi:hypothetical protein [Natrinema sp. 1APR25-10V2]|uniref:hypothetical protein n=1 Tax=Natrinema sp. 1APR25-10V2 TaxID=2951081 RepID=UPI002874E779|nr:hypothetical protein [Natrinema sp. 1APR25-10V2]MDS0473663.1 hypothetical protein [Natrinema sp. 1APR25-10V2]
MTSRVGIAMVVLALVSLVVSSGGVSSVVLERPIEIDVADDPSEQLVVFDRASNGSLTVTNQATANLTVERATVDESRVGTWASNASVDQPDEPIEPGENASVDVAGDPCAGAETTRDVPIELEVATDSTTIETTVDVAVWCGEDGGATRSAG